MSLGSSLSGLIGSIAEPADIETISNVKNPEIQNRIDQSLGDFDAGRESNRQTIADFTSRWSGDQAGAREAAEQEAANIDRFYNGEIEQALANLRNSRRQATEKAAQLAIDRGLRDVAGNEIRRGGLGFGSYSQGMLAKLMRDVEVDAALDDANQQRADFDYLEGNRIGLAGRRNALLDQATRRMLAPMGVRDAEEARLLRMLGGITQLDQMNKFYGLREEDRPIDHIADGLGEVVDLAASYFTGGLGGLGGGGGQEASPPPAYMTAPRSGGFGYGGYGYGGGYGPWL